MWVVMYIFKYLKVPNHIAFIMDGNRRFAKQKSLEVTKGHSSGFESLEKTLEWSLKLGVREITVYAFSIENFKRTQVEIDFIFTLAESKFEEFMKKKCACIKTGHLSKRMILGFGWLVILSYSHQKLWMLSNG
jgi:ditrans,polycis-polyprenyl diphosphate synthase